MLHSGESGHNIKKGMVKGNVYVNAIIIFCVLALNKYFTRKVLITKGNNSSFLILF